MAKIWCISAPLYSHTDWGGFLQTAQSLQAMGHDVIWVSEERLRKPIERQGLAFAPVAATGWLWPPPPQPDVSNMPPQEAVMLRYRRALDTWLSEDLVAAAASALIDLATAKGKPDVIVSDPFLTASALAAEALAVPFVVAGWPAQGNLNANELFPVQQDLGTDSQQRIQRLCDRFELSGLNFSKGPTPAILSPHLHISYFTPSWYANEMHMMLPQNVFVGGAPRPAQGDPPDWLTDIPPRIPLALVTLGTTFTGDLGFFAWGAQAAAKAHLLPVVAIGFTNFEPDQKQELIAALPKGTRLLNYVPFEHVLPRTRLMIHHGGMGTTHYAVAYGIPQIVVPHAADQRVQAKRVAQAKVGLHLSAHDVRQGMLWEGAEALMAHDKVKQDARQLADEMASLGGPGQAAQAILKVVNEAAH
jgi:MGT family glycosyltransferase